MNATKTMFAKQTAFYCTLQTVIETMHFCMTVGISSQLTVLVLINRTNMTNKKLAKTYKKLNTRQTNQIMHKSNVNGNSTNSTMQCSSISSLAFNTTYMEDKQACVVCTCILC